MRRSFHIRHSLAIRLACLWTLLLGAFTLASVGWEPATVAWGQEADNGEVDPFAPPAPAPPPAEGDAPAAPQDSVLAWAFKALGISYTVVFLGISFVFVGLFVMCILSARRENVCPAELIEGFEAQLAEKNYQDAYELARNDESFLGQVLAAGLAKVSVGYAQAIEAMQEVGEEENMKMEHRLSYLALIGTISPMVGLFGTVHGMINSFQVIARGGATPKPSELAQGISTALMTTLVGLAIAIPAIAAYNILRNRIAQLVLEVGIRSEELMGHFQEQR
jgi:biopolymer transport protein ExbB